MQLHARRIAAPIMAALFAATAVAAPVAGAIEEPGATLVVNDGGDVAADDGACTLREAITAVNDSASSGGMTGECAAGAPSLTDTIVFAMAVTTVTLAASLPAIDSNLIMDGGGHVTVSGDENYRPVAVNAGVTLTMRKIRIANVSMGTLGGAMIVDGTAIVQDTQFSNTGTNSLGGAIRVNATGNVTLTRVRLEAGAADLGGGAIYNAGTATLTDVLVSGFDTGDDGGAILNDTGATLTVLRSSFNANHAFTFNGGAIANAGTTTIANSTLAGNIAGGEGGAIYNTGTLTVINVTITDNSANAGSGIHNTGSALLKNALIVGNPSADDDNYVGSLTGGSVGNLIGIPGGRTINDILVAGQYGVFGGLTPTTPLSKAAGNPAVNTGDAATCAASPISNKDQRGVTRPAGACDIGATELDSTAPTFSTKPTATLLSGQSLVGSASKARISWAASDNGGGSGISFYRLQWSVDGLSYAEVNIEDWDASLRHQDVELARNHTYRFRARARDNDGNWSSWAYGPTFLARLVQQSAGSVDYTRTWTTKSNAVFSGGSVRYSKTAGASVSYRATGRAFAFITSKGPTRGKARIYVNGVLKATVDLYSATSKYRVQIWTKRYSDSVAKTIKVVVLGTSGRPRVDADAFVVLK